mgnify:CR=1 FL=1
MKDLSDAWIYQYLERITSEYENLLHEMERQLLADCDTVDLIDYIEARQRYQQAIKMQQDIILIMHIGRSGRD